MAKYPVYLDLSGRRVVVIGAGAVAARKAQALLAADARLVIVAEKIDDMLSVYQGTDVELVKSGYSKDYLAGAVLVIAATNNQKVNKQVYKDCQQLEILCNVVDKPELCDFFVPAVVKRGNLQIAISTEGDCPAYAGHIRKKLERIFSEKHGEFLSELQKIRKDIIEKIADLSRRKALLGQLADDESFEYFTQKGPEQWRLRAKEITEEYRAQV